MTGLTEESKMEFLLAWIPQSMMMFVINLKDRLEGYLNNFRSVTNSSGRQGS